jgi:hypothetical protein
MLDDLDKKEEERERQAEQRAKADATERAENRRKQREATEAALAARAENDRKKLEEMNATASAPPRPAAPGVLRGSDGHEYVPNSQPDSQDPNPAGQDTGGAAAPARGGGRPETQHAQQWHVDDAGNEVQDDEYDTESD